MEVLVIHSRAGMLIHLNCYVLSGSLSPLNLLRGVKVLPLFRWGLGLHPSKFVTSDCLYN